VSDPTEIRLSTAPVPGLRGAALAIAEAASATDAAAPFDEHTLLSLTAGVAGGEQRHLLLERDGEPIGYAHLDVALPGLPASAELAVHPQARRQGHGTKLILALGAVHESTRPGTETLQIWSHGDQPGARALAARLGYGVVRGLMQLRRPLEADAGLPAVRLPAGVRVRSFRPGTDDQDWLRLNAAAFAHHPEQGRMTQADLAARMSEDWFDPEGFLIAERDGVMIGFHWTKVHPADEDPQGLALGEVYVVGVDPAQHGGGLGTALTLAGLHHLRDAGLTTVLLYVEADNEPALAVYRKLQFTPWRTDVMYGSNARHIPDDQ
jgi:mycothiol synthase